MLYYLCNTMAERQKKRNIKSVEVNGYLLKKMDKLVDTDMFGSVSDVMNTALTELLVKIELMQDNSSAIDILVKMLQTPEGQKAFEKINKREQESQLDQRTESLLKIIKSTDSGKTSKMLELLGEELEKRSDIEHQSDEKNKQGESTAPSDKKTKKIVLFEDDVPHEYILE